MLWLVETPIWGHSWTAPLQKRDPRPKQCVALAGPLEERKREKMLWLVETPAWGHLWTAPLQKRDPRPKQYVQGGWFKVGAKGRFRFFHCALVGVSKAFAFSPFSSHELLPFFAPLSGVGCSGCFTT